MNKSSSYGIGMALIFSLIFIADQEQIWLIPITGISLMLGLVGKTD